MTSLATPVPVSNPVPLAAANRRVPVAAAAAGLAVLGLSLAVLKAPIDYRALGDAGYVGIFLLTLLACATFFAPVPYLAAIVVGGTFLNPVVVALVAGTAAALGELTGYAAGAKGRHLLPSGRWVTRLERGMERCGAPLIFLFAAIPNPVFDAVGVISGATRLPLSHFLLACFAGKTIRFWIFATLGTSLLFS